MPRLPASGDCPGAATSALECGKLRPKGGPPQPGIHGMMRIPHGPAWLAISLLALGPLLQAAEPEAPRKDKRPNILILLADDLRHDTLGVAGHPVVKTPHLDQLSREGMRFTHACVTTAICGVSRSSLLSGQWMSRHGNTSFKAMKTPWRESYPGLLRANGYHVGHVGKWHSSKFPAKEFDFGRAYSGTHWVKPEDGPPVHVTTKNEQDAIEFLDTRPKDKPFLLNLWFFAPHAQDEHPDQYLPQKETLSLYQDTTIPAPALSDGEAFRRLPPFLQAPENEGRVRFHWRFDTPDKYQRMMKNYLRLVSGVDSACGRVLRELETRGILDETIVIFTADNGYFHGERGLADKWYPYEESIRVPLIVRDPRLPDALRGGTNDSLVLNVDIAPTLLAAAGVKAPRTMQGRDFTPLLSAAGDAPAWRNDFLHEHAVISNKNRIPSSRTVVSKDLKFTEWPDWGHEQLFDLKSDPSELRNLAGDAASATTLERMRARLRELLEAAR